MCTVTFIPNSLNEFILTSNRDEAPGRETLSPQVYKEDDVQLTFPKDVVAGGTWIGLSERKRLICLLNGGFVAHERKLVYRMSRGVVVRDLLLAKDVLSAIEVFDFHDIEPFTIVLVRWESEVQLYELVWDGVQKHLTEKPLVPTIWSSSLLYTSEVKEQREQWFSQFLFDSMRPSEKDLLKFHTTAGTGDKANDLIMDRGFVKTKSITQVLKKEETLAMLYEEIQ